MSGGTLQSVDNALQILNILVEEGPELGVSELSRKLGLGKSTIHRLLSTLEGRNFVVQNPMTGKYKPGMRIVNLGAEVLRQINVIQEAHSHLEELSRRTGETTHLCLYNKGEITFVDKVVGNNPALMTSIIGIRKKAYCTGSGKVLVAFLPEIEREKYLRDIELCRYTPYTITSVGKLREVLEQIRQQGYGEDQQESEEGLVCFSAPVWSGKGEVIASISVSGAASRMNQRKEELIAHVKEIGNKISAACGWHPAFIWSEHKGGAGISG